MSDTQSKEFWDERYRSGSTPWYYDGVPPEFQRFLKRQSTPLRLLIPGCGTGSELHAALRLGHDAVAIDLSDEAVAQSRSRLGGETDRIFAGDFFTHPFETESFDLIYERTFLCALPPELRHAYAERVGTLLKTGGLLLGYFLYGEEPEPPPYPLARDEAEQLFDSRFTNTQNTPSEKPLPFFTDMEQWQIWRKKDS